MPRSLPDLLSLFDSLPALAPESGHARFVARVIAAIPKCTVGKDAAGLPAILIETNADEPRRGGAPLVLENLSIVHDVDCRLQLPGSGVETKRLSVIRCSDPERLLHEYFLRAVLPVLLALPAQPTRQQVSAGVGTLVSLFSQLSLAPRKTVMGLWAELFVIAFSRDPAALIRCWHALPDDRFDFAEGDERLEVKAAAGRRRSHRFALAQLRPPQGTVTVVASLLVERVGQGETITNLIERIRDIVTDADLLIRLDSTIARTLGSDWRQEGMVAFDLSLSQESLRFLDASNIPCVPEEIPPEVSEVQFRVDLSDQTGRPRNELESYGGLFRAAIPSQMF